MCSSMRAMLPPVRIGRIGASVRFGGGALNVLLPCDECRPTEELSPYTARNVNTVAATVTSPGDCIDSRQAGRFGGAFCV